MKKRQDYVYMWKFGDRWNWCRCTSNGYCISDSVIGYRSKAACIANAKRCMTKCEVRT